MTKNEAREKFLKGQAHPPCPSCKRTTLQTTRQFTPRDGSYWLAYRCVRCGETFEATIYPE